MEQSFKRVNIIGCPFDAISFPETIEYIRYCAVNGKRLHIITGNIDFVMIARRDPVFMKEMWEAELVVADGMPVVWAASLLGDPIKGRVNGTDIVWECAKISQETGIPVAFVGGDPEINEKARINLQKHYPGSRLFPIHTPFPLKSDDNEIIVEKIREINAKIVLIALGAPKQERWIKANLDHSGASVGIGIGSAFDIISGLRPRCPHWMKNLGLEWFHRLTLEPGRLWKRYLINDSPFLFYLLIEILKRAVKKLFFTRH